jgi:hypothetical protein
MRSAAFFSSNLRAAGARSTGRFGKSRRRDVDLSRRTGRQQPSSQRKLPAGARAKHVERLVTPRMRPDRKVVPVGFAAMVLH